MGLATFTVDVDELGHGPVVVNGEDISDRVAEIQVRARRGEPTVLLVRQVVGASRLEGEGVVQVLVDADGPVDETQVLRDWLANIDPTVLEECALAQFGGLEPPATNGEAWVRALQQLARS